MLARITSSCIARRMMCPYFALCNIAPQLHDELAVSFSYPDSLWHIEYTTWIFICFAITHEIETIMKSKAHNKISTRSAAKKFADQIIRWWFSDFPFNSYLAVLKKKTESLDICFITIMLFAFWLEHAIISLRLHGDYPYLHLFLVCRWMLWDPWFILQMSWSVFQKASSQYRLFWVIG